MSVADNIFPQIFLEKQHDSKNKLSEYLNNTGEKQIHELRTSIRKLEATYLVLPNSLKKKKTNDFVSSYKSIFRQNGSLRDFDVIIGKLLSDGFTTDSNPVKFLMNKKEKRIKDLLRQAKKVSDLRITRLKKGNFDKITPKYERVIFSLVQKVHDCMTVVLSDESKIKKLHSLRKTAKKLRYVLELDPNDSYLQLTSNMKALQKILGIIHDCDITVNFLKKHSKKFPEFKSLIIREEESRSNTYRKLVDSLSAE